MKIDQMKPGDKVAWCDLAGNKWISNVVDVSLILGTVTVQHLGSNSKLIVLLDYRISAWYTRKNNPEEYL